MSANLTTQCGNFKWNKIRNLDTGDFCKKSRNRSIIVYPCSHFGAYVFFFLHIVMKVALFYTQNRSESSTFCIILFHLFGDDCQSIPIFFFVIFYKSF
jgi:hypothetical protein